MADIGETERNGHHEVEIFQGGFQHEAAESAFKWKNCQKNPDHTNFISVQDFETIHLPKVQDTRGREKLRSLIDLTVRLRIHYTSRDRPDDDQFSHCRGSDKLRTGTGCIRLVSSHEFNIPCPCEECGGEITKKHWRLTVRTALHVVYNTEEGKETKVDLFLDDDLCDRDGRMKSVWGLEVLDCTPDRDRCNLLCVTCDKDLGEKIESVYRCYNGSGVTDLDPSDLDFLPNFDGDLNPALIVSHPHGQPKKITVGKVGQEDGFRVSHTAPTCPGSSGAPVFTIININDQCVDSCFRFPPVHCGSWNKVSSTNHKSQLNYGFWCYL